MGTTQLDDGVTYVKEVPAIREDAGISEAGQIEVADGDVTVLAGSVSVRAEDGTWWQGDQPNICYYLPGGRRGAAAFNKSTYYAGFWDGDKCGDGHSFGLHAGYQVDPAPIAISRFYLYG